MLRQIKEAVGYEGDPPAYTLILGAGASCGVIPTASELVGLADSDGRIHEKCIPLWLHWRNNDERNPGSSMEIVQKFWTDFVKQYAAEDAQHKPIILHNGFPERGSVPVAYEALFNPKGTGGINTPGAAQRFFQEICITNPIRLNATHFYLASLLSLQGRPGKGIGEKLLYEGKRPFARTIFTTNFDPLLQISLQIFQLLYYMTDRPDLPADALQTDQYPGIHLVYAHGSVHRSFSLVNTDEQRQRLKDANASVLASYFATHGVIVLGYSGWDDCLLNALNRVTTFKANLFWLARSETNLSQPVKQFLESHLNAFWVPIEDGGKVMADLHALLCPGMPNTELLYNPTRLLIKQLESVSLEGIPAAEEEPLNSRTPISQMAVPAASSIPKETEAIREKVLATLADVERLFIEPGVITSVLGGLARHADLSYSNQDWMAARAAYDSLRQEVGLKPETRVEAIFRRAYCDRKLRQTERAITGFTEIITMNDALAEQKASALLNRGGSYAEKGDLENAITDFSELVAMTEVQPEIKAIAWFTRGICYWEQGRLDSVIGDFSEVIMMDNAPLAQKARALVSRGRMYAVKGQREMAVSDFSAVIGMQDAPTAEMADALFYRGTSLAEDGQIETAITDFTEAISMKEIPTERKAKALYNRAVNYSIREETGKAMNDYSEIIAMQDVPVATMALALFDRGATYAQLGETDKAILDYDRLIGMQDAPEEQIAMALCNRADAYAGKGETQKALAGYGDVIAMKDAPAVEKARALFNRGGIYGKKGEVAKLTADYNQFIAMPEAPADLREHAKQILEKVRQAPIRRTYTR